MEDKIKKARTIIASLRKLLLNYELEELFCKKHIEIQKIKLEKFKNSRSKWGRKQFILTNAELDKNLIMLEQLNKSKKDLSANADLLLSSYNPTYKNIFSKFYIEEKTVEEISDKLKIPINEVRDIINKMNDDFIELYD